MNIDRYLRQTYADIVAKQKQNDFERLKQIIQQESIKAKPIKKSNKFKV